MSWPAIDRKMVSEEELGPALSEPALAKIRTIFSRYPTRRAALLPALHIAQDEIGYCSLRAMRQIADLLEIPPAAVMDAVTFYTHFWAQPKGRKTITVCRSIACELMGANRLLEALKSKLGIDEHQTTPDGRYSLVTEECLAECDHAPCLMINEKRYKNVRVEDLDRILADPANDRLEIPRSDLYDAPHRGNASAGTPHSKT